MYRVLHQLKVLPKLFGTLASNLLPSCTFTTLLRVEYLRFRLHPEAHGDERSGFCVTIVYSDIQADNKIVPSTGQWQSSRQQKNCQKFLPRMASKTRYSFNTLFYSDGLSLQLVFRKTVNPLVLIFMSSSQNCGFLDLLFRAGFGILHAPCTLRIC